MRVIFGLIVFLNIVIFSSPLFSKNYVLIIAGQSNANGRPPIDTISVLKESKKPLIGLRFDVRNHFYNRTKVWVDPNDSIRLSWGGYMPPVPGYTPSENPGWEPLNVNYNQFYQCGYWTADDNTTHASHGLEVEFAYAFETDPVHKDDELYIIKWAYGGISLAQNPKDIDWYPFSDHKMYYYFVNNFLFPAFSSRELSNYEPLGFWWSQGESDSMILENAEAYGENLENFFSILHSDVPQMKFFKNYIQQCETGSRIGGKYAEIVRQKQAEFCAISYNNCTVLNIDHLDFMAQNNDQTFVHLSSLGFKELSDILYPMMSTIN